MLKKPVENPRKPKDSRKPYEERHYKNKLRRVERNLIYRTLVKTKGNMTEAHKLNCPVTEDNPVPWYSYNAYLSACHRHGFKSEDLKTNNMLKSIQNLILLGYDVTFGTSHVYNNFRIVIQKDEDGKTYKYEQLMPHDHLYDARVEGCLEHMTEYIDEKIKEDSKNRDKHKEDADDPSKPWNWKKD